MLLAQFYLNEQVASFRLTCKMLYLQLNVFLDLAANGFCIPKNLDIEEGETDEAGENTQQGGMGLVDGEGTKDVSDRIESEDQLEDARPADQEQEKQEDNNCKEEERGIDMSENFDSHLQDLENDNEDEEQSDDDDGESDLDKEMGETGENADQLDKEIWGDDKEKDEDENQQPENENEKEGTGEQTGEKELTANDDRDRQGQHKDDENENQQEDSKKEINELNEPEMREDQIDPYHGKFEPQLEPEPLDLPEDLNLDEDDKEDGAHQEENPFDIDEMKDSKPPPDETEDKDFEEVEDDKQDDLTEDSNEDENENGENMGKDEQSTRDELENNKDNEEKNGENAETGENKEDEEKTEEEDLREKAAPSANDASQQVDAVPSMEETMEGSRDAVAQEQRDKDQQQRDALSENTQEDSKDNGNGQSESVEQESGHSGFSKQEIMPAPQRSTTQQKKNKKPNRSNEDRSLLDSYEPQPKKLKTLQTEEEVSNNKEDDFSSNSNKAEMAQHIHKDSEKFDDYTLDAATEDQLKQQASNEEKENENEDEKKDNNTDLDMHEDEEIDTTDVKVTEQEPNKMFETNDKKQKNDANGEKILGENVEMEPPVELEGEAVGMPWVQRGNESTAQIMEYSLEHEALSSSYIENKRSELMKTMNEWQNMPSTEEATAVWNGVCSITDAAARDLSEKLRLILEPTQASRLKGDYKTGKRINMRKIIPYIASQFRKDKIWLRRTKPSKRNYQIILAVDDSTSMSHNQSNEIAFESFSLISKAMTYLEVGQLGIVSFGDSVRLLHPLG